MLRTCCEHVASVPRNTAVECSALVVQRALRVAAPSISGPRPGIAARASPPCISAHTDPAFTAPSPSSTPACGERCNAMDEHHVADEHDLGELVDVYRASSLKQLLRLVVGAVFIGAGVLMLRDPNAFDRWEILLPAVVCFFVGASGVL